MPVTTIKRPDHLKDIYGPIMISDHNGSACLQCCAARLIQCMHLKK